MQYAYAYEVNVQAKAASMKSHINLNTRAHSERLQNNMQMNNEKFNMHVNVRSS